MTLITSSMEAERLSFLALCFLGRPHILMQDGIPLSEALWLNLFFSFFFCALCQIVIPFFVFRPSIHVLVCALNAVCQSEAARSELDSLFLQTFTDNKLT